MGSLAGGRFTKPAESRYSPVEGEFLAVTDALYKSRHFVLGCDKLTVAVDHEPLLGFLNDKSMADIENPRLLMLKEKTLWFTFNVIHLAGRLNSGLTTSPGQLEQRLQQKRHKTLLTLSLDSVLHSWSLVGQSEISSPSSKGSSHHQRSGWTSERKESWLSERES